MDLHWPRFNMSARFKYITPRHMQTLSDRMWCVGYISSFRLFREFTRLRMVV